MKLARCTGCIAFAVLGSFDGAIDAFIAAWPLALTFSTSDGSTLTKSIPADEGGVQEVSILDKKITIKDDSVVTFTVPDTEFARAVLPTVGLWFRGVKLSCDGE